MKWGMFSLHLQRSGCDLLYQAFDTLLDPEQRVNSIWEVSESVCWHGHATPTGWGIWSSTGLEHDQRPQVVTKKMHIAIFGVRAAVHSLQEDSQLGWPGYYCYI